MRALHKLLAACLLASVIVLTDGQQVEPQGSTAYKHKQHSRHKQQAAPYPAYPPQPPHRVPSPSPRPPPPAPLPPPDCNCNTFPELATRAGSCVNCTAGIPARLNVTSCRALPTSFCKAVNTQWSCIYPYKRAGFRCARRDGDCDLDDFCTGASPACVDRVLNQSRVCRRPPGACVLPTLCDGVSHTCPSRKRLVRDGEPCVVDGGGPPGGQAGPYSEVLDETGKVAVTSAAKAGEAKEREWATCQRCFGGVCKAFKFAWMHKTAGAGKQRHYAYDGDNGDEAGHAASRKAGVATKRHSEFEPQFFCQREEGASYDGGDG